MGTRETNQQEVSVDDILIDLMQQIREMEVAMLPFYQAAGRVPADAKDNEKVYLNTLTAGDYRKVRKVYAG